MLHILVVLTYWLLVQWLFKVMIVLKKEIYEHSLKMWPLQHPFGHVIAIRAFGNRHIFMSVTESCGHVIVICNLHCQFPRSKVSGEVSKNLQVAVMWWLAQWPWVIHLRTTAECRRSGMVTWHFTLHLCCWVTELLVLIVVGTRGLPVWLKTKKLPIFSIV